MQKNKNEVSNGAPKKDPKTSPKIVHTANNTSASRKASATNAQAEPAGKSVAKPPASHPSSASSKVTPPHKPMAKKSQQHANATGPKSTSKSWKEFLPKGAKKEEMVANHAVPVKTQPTLASRVPATKSKVLNGPGPAKPGVNAKAAQNKVVKNGAAAAESKDDCVCVHRNGKELCHCLGQKDVVALGHKAGPAEKVLHGHSPQK